LAAKYQEVYPPECEDFSWVSEHSYTRKQIFEFESVVLDVLEWELLIPSSLDFLRRFSKAAKAEFRAHELAKYICEVCMMNAGLVVALPSKIAATATYLSRLMTGVESKTLWTPALEHYTTYKEEDVQAASIKVNDILIRYNNSSSLRAMRKKYAKNKHKGVSNIPLVSLDDATKTHVK
jgi:Cyclin, C-terminal domain/Cyclin, N-terminal domain